MSNHLAVAAVTATLRGVIDRAVKASGVARQYSDTLGKVGNCQITVNCHYAEWTIAWPVATRLYLPKDWADDAERRKKAKVPKESTFRIKPEIALGLLDQARAWGVRPACVVADADYGDNPNFLAGLKRRRQRYVVAVRADFAVAPGSRPGVTTILSPYLGKFKSMACLL